MTRLTPSLARRVDRLARRAHAFHRWAHHPLCARYQPEVIRLGRRTRVCRGCALCGLGVLAGLVAGLALSSAPGPAWLAVAALLAATVPLAIPRLPRAAAATAGAGRRRSKLLTRFLPLAVAGGALAQALIVPAPARLGAAALAVLATAWGVARYRRRGPDRERCRTCPEGPPGERCSGFVPLVRRERAMARLAGRWIAAAGPAGVAGRGP